MSRKPWRMAQATPGIAGVRPYSREESARLLEPWLGSGLALGELPVPRLIVVRVGAGRAARPRRVAPGSWPKIPGATLDDHRGYVDRMRAMARSAVVVGLGVLALVLAAAMMSVMFATRGAMAANRQIIEVLHVVGAKEGFIAAEFQRHFLLLGLKGGAIGGVTAMALFALAGIMSDWFKGSAGREPGRGAVRQPRRSARKDMARWSA